MRELKFRVWSEEDFTIQFVGWIPTLKDGHVYSIFDLCGEKE